MKVANSATEGNLVFYLSWNSRRASWAQILTSPSTSRLSRGLRASQIPRTQRVISRGLYT